MKVGIRIHELDEGLMRASCPSLPGCVVYGYSREEIRREIERAARRRVANGDGKSPAGRWRASVFEEAEESPLVRN